MDKLQSRRREFLKFLVASPLLSVSARLLAEETLAKSELPDYLITKPEDALDVFDCHAQSLVRHRPLEVAVVDAVAVHQPYSRPSATLAGPLHCPGCITRGRGACRR